MFRFILKLPRFYQQHLEEEKREIDGLLIAAIRQGVDAGETGKRLVVRSVRLDDMLHLS